MMEDQLTLYGQSFPSRLILGTARYESPAQLADAIRRANPAMLTVSLRRQLPGKKEAGQAFWNLLRETGKTILPNTAGCHTVHEAVTTACMARELFKTTLIKLEVPSAPARGHAIPLRFRSCESALHMFHSSSMRALESRRTHARLWSGALTVCCSTPRSHGRSTLCVWQAHSPQPWPQAAMPIARAPCRFRSLPCPARPMSVALSLIVLTLLNTAIKPKRNGHRILNAGAGTTTPYHHALHGDTNRQHPRPSDCRPFLHRSVLEDRCATRTKLPAQNVGRTTSTI
jgi:hypothetical protein